MKSTIEIEQVPISKKFIPSGGYRVRLANPEAADPRTHKPVSVKMTVESHGGVAESRRQTHRIKAKVPYS